MDTTGTHLLASYSGCDAIVLGDHAAIESMAHAAALATGATVVGHKTHVNPAGGVVSVVVLAESHISIHTTPEAGFAAVDIFTCGDCDPHLAPPILHAALKAASSDVMVLERGQRGPRAIVPRGQRPVERIVVDCSPSQLPDTVCVRRSPGRGLGLFATQDLAAGDLIYVTPMWLASYDTEYVLQTEVGESTLTADELGSELSTSEVRDFPDDIREAVILHFGLKDPSARELRDALTDDTECEVLVTAFDGLINHASDSNVRVDQYSRGVTFENDEPVWMMGLYASKSIAAGEELFWDYAESADFVPPSSWN